MASCKDMTDEPTTNPINDDDNDPATKGGLSQLRTALITEIEG